eukprot:474879-Rhodomonas_salina.1
MTLSRPSVRIPPIHRDLSSNVWLRVRLTCDWRDPSRAPLCGRSPSFDFGFQHGTRRPRAQ